VEIVEDPDEQKAIAGVLSSLDDKIDLLHRQNKTLEALAETLFRQWFVEEASKEWADGTLGDIVIVKYGKAHKNLADGAIPAYGSGGIMRYVDTPLCLTESVLIPRKGTLGNIIYIDEPFWTVDTMFYTEMKIPNVAKYVYFLVKSQDMASMNVGSAVPSMTTEVLNTLLITIPSNDVLKHFDEAVSPMFIKMKVNKIQIRTLEKLRDTLLPKLMSGEVRVAC
jgi:type I restriction enzyme S subunit